ncbi:MAG: hypothetical protein V5A84_00760 [Planctomycetota bacterium]
MLAALPVLILAAAGCSLITARPASGPAWTRPEVVRTLRSRYEKIRTIKAGDVSLESSSESGSFFSVTPTLGGVLALDPHLPGLWLRTEKLGQQIFTLGLRKQSFWMTIPDTREIVTGSGRAFRKFPYTLRPAELAALVGSPRQLGLDRESTLMAVEPEHYRFDVWSDSTLAREVYVDRADVTVRRVVYYGRDKRRVAELTLGDYRTVNGIPLPHHLSLVRPGSGVRTEIWLSAPEVNAVSPRQMSVFFSPPQKPGWRHIDLNRQSLRDIKALQNQQ